MNNIGSIINTLMNSKNPQQIAMQMLQSRGLGNNPMMQNVMGMINNQDCSGLETFARNMAKSKNANIDDLINQVQQYMK